MAERPTIRDLMQYGEITTAQLTDAVNTYWHDPETIAYALGGSYVLNLAEAVRSSPETRRSLADETLPDVIKRAAVRKAILLARPAKV